MCLASPPTATVLHARTQRPHRGPDTSAGTRAAVSTPHASHPPRGGTGVEAMTDGLLGLRAEPQHGVPIQLLPPVPGPQRDSAPRPVLRWHSWEPLLIWVTRANVEIILTIPSSPAPARAPRAGQALVQRHPPRAPLAWRADLGVGRAGQAVSPAWGTSAPAARWYAVRGLSLVPLVRRLRFLPLTASAPLASPALRGAGDYSRRGVSCFVLLHGLPENHVDLFDMVHALAEFARFASQHRVAALQFLKALAQRVLLCAPGRRRGSAGRRCP